MTYSYAFGINSSGDAVGSSPDPSFPGRAGYGRATVYLAGGERKLLLVPGDTSVALAINDSRLVVGYVSDPSGAQAAFLYDYATSAYTDVHGEIVTWWGSEVTSSAATAVNAVGDVVGWFRDASWRARAFLRHPDGSYAPLDLPSILDADAEPTGINASGQVVGTANAPSGNPRAILWTNGTPQDLGMLLPAQGVSPGSAALGINTQGHVVGWSNYGWFATHAVLFSNGGIQDINELIPDPGPVLDVATAINDAGQIVAYAGGSTEGPAVLLTPTALAMVGDLIGLVQGFGLPGGVENSLVTKLEDARAALAAGDVTTVCDMLGAFTNEVRAQSGKKLTTAQADQIISAAERIRLEAGCA